ncbi:MAG: O-antigen ligase family protein [Nitrospirota bacterium]
MEKYGQRFQNSRLFTQKDIISSNINMLLSQKYSYVILILGALIIGSLIVVSSNLIILPFLASLVLLFIIKPHIGLYTIFLTDIWFSYHEGPISRRTIILFFVVSIYMIYFFYKKKFKIDKKVNYIVYTIFVLLLWGLFTDFLINKVPLKNFYASFARLWLPVLIALLLYFFIEKEKHLDKFIYIIIFGVSISGLIGILQFFWGGVFYDIVPRPENMNISSGVIFGLSGMPHIYASQLASTIPLILSIILSQHKFRKILLISFAILTIALILTFVRSAIYGCTIGIITLFLFRLKKKIAIKINILIVILLLLFSVLSGMTEHGKRLFQVEGSALGRIPLAISAFYIAKDNPFGVGRGKYTEEVEEYLWQLKRFEYYHVVTVTTPHNQFLNVLVYWGIPGFLLLLFFYYKILKQVNIIRKTTNNEYLKTLSIGLFCSYIAYIINSLFHNNGAFTGDPFHWYFIGLTFCLIKLTIYNKRP